MKTRIKKLAMKVYDENGAVVHEEKDVVAIALGRNETLDDTRKYLRSRYAYAAKVEFVLK